MLFKKAFTLVEMMVVVFVIGLLVAIIMPSLGRARELANRSTCANNVREIVKACMTYALSTSEQGNTPKALPVISPPPTANNWWDFKNGNRGCLWLLVKYQYVVAESFLCPSARFHAAKPSDDQLGESTCAYSYISMVDPTGNRPPISTIDRNSIAGLVILADLNTRFKPGSIQFADGSTNGYFGTNHNSQIHNKGEGQNIGRIDNSVGWNTTGMVATGVHSNDYIYESNSFPGDTDGAARAADDVFLLP
jgi:prepilin-type N-terminal cleavage/methylation domain-containing protein